MKGFPLAKKRKIYNYAKTNEITTIKLGFVNSFLIKGENKLILVDTGTPGSAQKIVKSIKNLGFIPSQVSLIILTHIHMDHCGSINELKRITGAKIAVHKDDAKCLTMGQSAEIIPNSALGRLFSLITKNMKRSFDGIKPDILIDNELSLNSFGIKGRILPTPGHTPGSVSILLDSGKCIIGDILTSFGKLNYSPFSTDFSMLKESLMKIMNTSAKEIYISHGGVYSMDKIRKNFMNGN